MPKTTRTPKYRRHRPSGQAVVTLDGKDFYLGPHGSAASRQQYDRLTAEWLAAGRCLPRATPANDLTIIELCAAYLRWSREHYGPDSGNIDRIRAALKALRHAYGPTPAVEFGPLALQVVQRRLIKGERVHSRRYVNYLTGAIKRIFRWAASQELLPVSVYHALATVPGLRRGRSSARESKPILPVDDATIAATLPYLPAPVAAMVQAQRLTGCRAGEIVIMRPCDIDRSGKVWCYRPATHKGTHLERERVIFIGPKAQAILAPWLLRDATSYCFSPRETKAAHNAAHRASRRSPVTPSQAKRHRAHNPKVAPGDFYLVRSYAQAVRRAVELADKAAHQERPDVPGNQVLVPHWSPLRLRHAAATEIRAKYNLEGTQAVLGHAHARISEVYAERDMAKAERIMAEVG